MVGMAHRLKLMESQERNYDSEQQQNAELEYGARCGHKYNYEFAMVLEELMDKATDLRMRYYGHHGKEMAMAYRGDVAMGLRHVTKAEMRGERYEPVCYGTSDASTKQVP